MPSHLKAKKEEKAKLFSNRIIEFLSRAPFGVPHAMWVLIAILFFWYSVYKIELPVLYIISLGVIGAFSWTFMEYIIHRFLYHTETN